VKEAIHKMNNKPYICVLPMETKVRDLDARLYLGLQLVEAGFEVILGHKSGVHRAMFTQKKSFIYFDKGLDPKGDKFYQKIKENSSLIVVLDEEGGVYTKDYTVLEHRVQENALKYVDIFFTWGDKQKKLIEEKRILEPEHIITTGHPRFDMRKKPFEEYYRQLGQRDVLIKDRKLILVNSSFALGNNQLMLNDLIDFERGQTTFHISRNALENRAAYHSQVMEYFINATIKISENNPTIIIVYRPHPAENVNKLRTIFKNYSNVLVTNDGSVQEWIVHAEVVLHHDCSTGIEAFLYGTPTISYCPIFDERYAQEVPIKISEVIDDEERLLSRIGEVLNDARNGAISNRADKMIILKTIIDNVNYESSNKICDVLKNYLDGNHPNIKSFSKYDSSYLSTKNRLLQNSLIEYVKNKVSPKRIRIIKRSKSKWPGLSKSEIAKRIYLINKLFNNERKYKIRDLGNMAFQLSK
jgi:surface carbohydrate biosynthesis protein